MAKFFLNFAKVATRHIAKFGLTGRNSSGKISIKFYKYEMQKDSIHLFRFNSN